MIHDDKPPLSELAHHGIKGMKWGIRKIDPNGGPRPLEKKEITKTTKSGDVFTLSPIPNTRMGEFLASHSKRVRKNVNTTSFMDIKDKNGATIGNLQLWRKSPKEINVIWIDMEESARGRGYASAVMKEVANIAKRDGADRVTLEVPGISPDARHIYEKQGFKVTEEPKNTRGVWGGLTKMELPLKKTK